MYINMYEIFEKMENTRTRAERIALLQKHDSQTLRLVLRAAFHPNIKFFLTERPYYRPSALKPGMADYTMHNAIQKMYIFEIGHPKAPKELTNQRRLKVLSQLLENMEHKEAEILIAIMLKKLKVSYLTENLVAASFPGLIPYRQTAEDA